MSNELGNTPADKNYKPSGISKSEEAALKAYPINIQATQLYGDWDINKTEREGFVNGYEQAEKDIIAIIESRISEIIGDAQPKPALRAELEELIKRITEAKK